MIQWRFYILSIKTGFNSFESVAPVVQFIWIWSTSGSIHLDLEHKWFNSFGSGAQKGSIHLDLEHQQVNSFTKANQHSKNFTADV